MSLIAHSIVSLATHHDMERMVFPASNSVLGVDLLRFAEGQILRLPVRQRERHFHVMGIYWQLFNLERGRKYCAGSAVRHALTRPAYLAADMIREKVGSALAARHRVQGEPPKPAAPRFLVDPYSRYTRFGTTPQGTR